MRFVFVCVCLKCVQHKVRVQCPLKTSASPFRADFRPSIIIFVAARCDSVVGCDVCGVSPCRTNDCLKCVSHRYNRPPNANADIQTYTQANCVNAVKRMCTFLLRTASQNTVEKSFFQCKRTIEIKVAMADNVNVYNGETTATFATMKTIIWRMVEHSRSKPVDWDSGFG